MLCLSFLSLPNFNLHVYRPRQHRLRSFILGGRTISFLPVFISSLVIFTISLTLAHADVPPIRSNATRFTSIQPTALSPPASASATISASVTAATTATARVDGKVDHDETCTSSAVHVHFALRSVLTFSYRRTAHVDSLLSPTTLLRSGPRFDRSTFSFCHPPVHRSPDAASASSSDIASPSLDI